MSTIQDDTELKAAISDIVRLNDGTPLDERIDALAALVARREALARTEGELSAFKAVRDRAHSVTLLIPFDNLSVSDLFREIDNSIAVRVAALTTEATQGGKGENNAI